MPSTYTPIATQTLGSAAASVTFSSISGAYTDLKIVYATTASSSAVNYLRFNSDTGSNYSRTFYYGDGTGTASGRETNITGIYTPFTMSTAITTNIIDIMNYSNTTTNKTCLVRSGATNNIVGAGVCLWRSTAAITSISIFCDAANFVTGSTFTLYGIKAA
jgi:hypothetical protein